MIESSEHQDFILEHWDFKMISPTRLVVEWDMLIYVGEDKG